MSPKMYEKNMTVTDSYVYFTLRFSFAVIVSSFTIKLILVLSKERLKFSLLYCIGNNLFSEKKLAINVNVKFTEKSKLQWQT